MWPMACACTGVLMVRDVTCRRVLAAGLHQLCPLVQLPARLLDALLALDRGGQHAGGIVTDHGKRQRVLGPHGAVAQDLAGQVAREVAAVERREPGHGERAGPGQAAGSALGVVGHRLGKDPAVRHVEDTTGTLVGIHPIPDLDQRKGEKSEIDDVAGELAALLTARGATVIHVPLLAVVEPIDGGTALRDVLSDLREFDWLVVTSAAGAERVGRAAAETPG